MAKDVLEKELTVSGKLEENGIKAGTNSRFAVAIDRLGGNVADFVNLLFEPGNRKKRAISEAEIKVIEAAATAAARAVKEDPQTAVRVIAGMVGAAARKQESKDAVLQEALEDLRNDAPTEAQAANEEPLSEEFLSRFEHYAEDAITDELRKRWGRVLASEVRAPGTFSRKVLRVVDELDSDTAKAFEELCRHRIDDVVPRALSGRLSFGVSVSLTGADLIVDPTGGQRRLCRKQADGTGTEMWVFRFGDNAIAIDVSTKIEPEFDLDSIKPLMSLGDPAEPAPSIPTYVLTSTGRALASILPVTEQTALHEFARAAAKQIEPSWVRVYQLSGSEFVMTSQLDGTAAAPDSAATLTP
ncbi:DUF2806 domain-containing protein [Devosia sp. Root105]|uniref:DUF2806 domain-containing protein n=1 Tax=Devosia sp. Root105 TaxID=1736423 RepID=UPI0006F81F29|nr:DUF2806 domain-containing protein [Devosia sp. Root105]KQU96454.1 hypothetical protein ASC68_13835 [Devosia sp. Root105]